MTCISSQGMDVLLEVTALAAGLARQVRMPDPTSCAKVLEIIRARKQAAVASSHPTQHRAGVLLPSQQGSSAASCGPLAAPRTAAEPPAAAFAIHSSPLKRKRDVETPSPSIDILPGKQCGSRLAPHPLDPGPPRRRV